MYSAELGKSLSGGEKCDIILSLITYEEGLNLGN